MVEVSKDGIALEMRYPEAYRLMLGFYCDPAFYNSAPDCRPADNVLMAIQYATATLQAERDRYRVALEAVAAFAPKSAAGSKIEQVLQNEWNRAGEYAATIARTALSDTPTVQS